MKQQNGQRGLLRTIAVAMCIVLAALPMAALAAGGASKNTGPDKVYRQYITERVRMLQQLGSYAQWSLQDKVALEKILLDDGRLQEPDAIVNVVPVEGDFSYDKAPYDVAITAINKEFGVTSEQLGGGYTLGYSFVRQAGALKWMVLIYPWGPNPHEPYTVYHVDIASPSGEVTSCTKEEVAARMPINGEAIQPIETDKSEEEAIQLARKSLTRSRARLTEGVLSTFVPAASLVVDSAKKRYWLVQFQSSDPVLNEYFGTFTIKLAAKTGKVVSIDGASNRELTKK